jgi:transposase InsO family protein
MITCVIPGSRYSELMTKLSRPTSLFLPGCKLSTARKCHRSDRGSEYTSNQFIAHLKQQGTERRLTTVDTPQHNGVAESLNCRLMKRTRAILLQAGLPKNLWAEAIHFTVWLKNHTSTKARGTGPIPRGQHTRGFTSIHRGGTWGAAKRKHFFYTVSAQAKSVCDLSSIPTARQPARRRIHTATHTSTGAARHA